MQILQNLAQFIKIIKKCTFALCLVHSFLSITIRRIQIFSFRIIFLNFFWTPHSFISWKHLVVSIVSSCLHFQVNWVCCFSSIIIVIVKSLKFCLCMSKYILEYILSKYLFYLHFHLRRMGERERENEGKHNIPY